MPPVQTGKAIATKSYDASRSRRQNQSLDRALSPAIVRAHSATCPESLPTRDIHILITRSLAMKRFSLFCVSAACLFAGIGSLQAADSKEDARQEAIKQDRKKYFGEWEFTSLVVDGNELSAENVKRFKVVNGADGTWNVSVDGDIKLQGRARSIRPNNAR